VHLRLPPARQRPQEGLRPHLALADTQREAGLAAGPTLIAAPDDTTSPLKIHGPGSNLPDSTLLELTPNGELILAGGSGNGYRFAELMSAQSVRLVRRVESEDACRSHGGLHSALFQPVIPERRNR